MQNQMTLLANKGITKRDTRNKTIYLWLEISFIHTGHSCMHKLYFHTYPTQKAQHAVGYAEPEFHIKDSTST